MKTTRVIVTAASKSLPAVVAQLKKRGMKVDSVLDLTGTVLGEIEPTKIAALQEIPGVTVEREGAVKIPPPDAEVQ